MHRSHAKYVLSTMTNFTTKIVSGSGKQVLELRALSSATLASLNTADIR